ncbi:hypothetical protein [Anaerobiospirillum succiniciproducens]|uniref:hypothetical protein n=1 Tax=Anaerobiospirillum succiniciproducens TaxID=13335 RepID=UPI003F8C5558
MVDFQRVHDCFSKAASSYYDDAVMQSKMASRLIDLICSNLPSTNTSCYAQAQGQSQDSHGYKVLEIGCGPGNFTTQLLSKLPIKDLCLNDLSLQMLEQNMLNLYEQGFITRDQQILSMQGHTSKWQPLTQAHEATDQPQATNKLQSFTAICGDARLLSKLKAQAQEHELALAHGHVQAKAKAHEPVQAKARAKDKVQADGEVAAGAAAGVFSSSFDLIVSNASFQWFEDLAAALLGFKQLARAKTKATQEDAAILGQGYSVLAFSSFYAGHFAEVKELTDVGLNYLTKEKVIEALERCQLDYQVFFDEELQYFNSSVELFRHLHVTGVNGIAATPLSAGSLRRIMREYEERFTEKMGVRLTWHPYYVIAKLH